MPSPRFVFVPLRSSSFGANRRGQIRGKPVANNRLSASFVRSAKPGRYCDGDGLYLLVKKSGARFWVFRYKVNGWKVREADSAALGKSEIAFASQKHATRRLCSFGRSRIGIDPLAAREVARTAAKAATQDAAIRASDFSRSSSTLSSTVTRRHGEIQSTPPNGPRPSRLTPTPSSGICRLLRWGLRTYLSDRRDLAFQVGDG